MLNRRCLVGRNPGPPSMALHRRRLLGRRLLLLLAWPRLLLCCGSGPRGTTPSARRCGSARIGLRERSSTAAARGSQTRMNTYVRAHVHTYACTLLPGLPPSAYMYRPHVHYSDGVSPSLWHLQWVACPRVGDAWNPFTFPGFGRRSFRRRTLSSSCTISRTRGRTRGISGWLLRWRRPCTSGAAVRSRPWSAGCIKEMSTIVDARVCTYIRTYVYTRTYVRT